MGGAARLRAAVGALPPYYPELSDVSFDLFTPWSIPSIRDQDRFGFAVTY